ncbi:transposon ty3-i Gag-Pol polyprotein [Plakobranchus ocellatus]|uniref:Transposon ty3-i Gag-Pol polyprotein n=1 Tax=Plakobranchus ocellatus TaxID=259542 RepID=A0AAV4AET4_9GAST|nr:transposon ty3-i Gag-Pol polyprotein [Plakobranchus ocellatus]
MSQEVGESVDNFIVRLRNKADKCSFTLENKDERISEQLIKGIHMTDEKKKLISKGEALTLTMAIEMARSFEVSHKDLNEYMYYNNNTKAGSAMKTIEAVGMRRKMTREQACGRCGTHHSPRTCPAYKTVCQKYAEWQWTPTREAAFKKLKDLIHEDLILRYFNPNIPTIIEVDSSLHGLGAVLLQENKPIAFASKALTDTEKRYAKIERELLAVVFGRERFHTYIYGKPVTVKSDHNPLQHIQQKNIGSAPPRLQRMLVRIQPYDSTIEYKPGPEMTIADYLSRVNPKAGETIEPEATVHAVTVTDEKFDELRRETKKDPEFGPLLEQIIMGWPERSMQVQKSLRKYWSI